MAASPSVTSTIWRTRDVRIVDAGETNQLEARQQGAWMLVPAVAQISPSMSSTAAFASSVVATRRVSPTLSLKYR